MRGTWCAPSRPAPASSKRSRSSRPTCPSWTARGSGGRALAEQALDKTRVRRLDEVQVAPGLLREAPVVVAAIGGDRNDAHAATVLVAQTARDFEAVQAGQPYVEQDDIGTQTPSHFDGRRTARRHFQLVALRAEERL